MNECVGIQAGTAFEKRFETISKQTEPIRANLCPKASTHPPTPRPAATRSGIFIV